MAEVKYKRVLLKLSGESFARSGERVRIRLLDFSPMQHHPIHLHGHTFWVTGSEGGRIPESAWLTGAALMNCGRAPTTVRIFGCMARA